MRMRHHRAHAAGHARNDIADVEHAAHDDSHLHKIEDCHRKHAAEGGVGEHNGRAQHHALRLRDRAAGDHKKHQPQRLDLRRHPTKVGRHDGQRTQNFYCAVVAQPVVIADGEQVHAIQLAGEKQAGENQAQARTEGIGHHAAQAVFDEGGRDAEHSFRAEPGGEHRCHHDGQGQTAAGDREVLGVMYARGGDQADGQRNQQVDNDKPDQHAAPPITVNAGIIKLAQPEKQCD